MLHLKISPILTKMFQSSLDQATLPSEWKEANIHRVFKKDKMGGTQELQTYFSNLYLLQNPRTHCA